VHVPLLRSFWERELLDLPGYRCNVVSGHRRMLELAPVRRADLDRWVELFAETIDELFTGPVAERAKPRAADVAVALERLAAHHERTST